MKKEKNMQTKPIDNNDSSPNKSGQSREYASGGIRNRRAEF